MDENVIELLVRQMLKEIGEDPKREGLLDTPKRIAKMYNEIFRGYDKAQAPKVTTFKNGQDGIIYDQMIVDSGNFYSQCEHHMIPFFGEYYFAYIPNRHGKILGLSKVARVVDYYSAKLQVQERLVQEVVDYLWKNLIDSGSHPKGMALVMKGKHLCKCMRGARKDGWMITSEMKGVFKTNAAARTEFLSFVHNA